MSSWWEFLIKHMELVFDWCRENEVPMLFEMVFMVGFMIAALCICVVDTFIWPFKLIYKKIRKI